MPRGAALLTHATLGALAITAITAAMPPQGKAAGSRSAAPTAPASAAQLSSSPAKESHMPHPHHTISEALSSHAYGEGSPMRPRSKVVHVPVRGSTLVVPLCCAGRDGGGSSDAAGAVRRAGGGAAGGFGFLHRAKTVEAPIELTDGEVTLMANRQYRVRDSVFIH